MGYTTEFEGRFTLNKPLDDETFAFLTKLSETRRMKRSLPEEYGVEGEFFVDSEGDYGQSHDESIVDYNTPPATQPSLWCDWVPSDDRLGIEHNGGEKFYHYVEWIKYIAQKILAPKGYSISGKVAWRGECFHDYGVIVAEDNKIETKGVSF